jgi:hypothetical protein
MEEPEEKIGASEKKAVADDLEKKNSPDHHVASQRQREHLKYARDVKKQKQLARDLEVKAQRKNLDFIYNRLTSIEQSLDNMMKIDGVARREKVKGKRKRDPDTSSESEIKKMSKKFEETPNKTPENSGMWNFIPSVAGKALVIGASAFVFSLLKQYATTDIQTTDRDTVNGYLMAKDY